MTCPHAEPTDHAHADIAECLDMPVGTLLTDEDGAYCPACGWRPTTQGEDQPA